MRTLAGPRYALRPAVVAGAVLTAAASVVAPAPTARGAASAFVGFGAISGGDDRPKPAALVGGTIGDGWYATLFLYGERFAIVSRNAQIASAGRRWTLPYSFTKRFSVAGGASLLREETRIGASGNTEGESDTSWNAGGNIAFGFRPLDFAMGGVRGFVDVDWNSHVFPAGLATIFLATGRRHALSLAVGVRFP